MWSFTRLRNHPHFAKHFAHVHPLCWLILWWELNRLIRWFETYRPEDVLYSTSEWGFITVRYIAPRIDPTLYKPLPRTFRPLSDPSWASDTPAGVLQLAKWHAFIVPCSRGGGGISRSEMPEAALPSPFNTS